MFYRLNIFSINIPPLRDRRDDMPLLAGYFSRKVGRHLRKIRMDVSPGAMARLVGYHWPGNVRELENALERSINVASGDRIMLEHLPEYLAPGELERKAILATLIAVDGNIARAARIMGVSRNTLYSKLQQYETGFKGA